jgi:PIN domain nuclease of toxin-antitoxin system
VGRSEVNYLLDTSAWLRSTMEMETVPPGIRRLLHGKDEVFGLSVISLWEVGKKHQIGKLELKIDLLSWLRRAVTSQIMVIQITPEIVAEAMELPSFPNRDPGDELIVATARVHNLTLITSDTALKNYKHAKILYFKALFPE